MLVSQSVSQSGTQNFRDFYMIGLDYHIGRERQWPGKAGGWPEMAGDGRGIGRGWPRVVGEMAGNSRRLPSLAENGREWT